jgi:hypothetical protein
MGLIFTTAFGQSKKWISYDNPRTNMIGRQVIEGDFASVLPSITSEDIKEDDGSNYSKRKIDKQFKLDIGNIFNTSTTKLTDVVLVNIKIDQIKQSSFGKVYPNQKFVYKGLKADKIILKTELKSNTSLNLKKLIEQYEQLKSIIPDIDITKILADTIRIKRERIFTDTISNPNVYYLLQIAEFKTNLGTGKNKGRSLDRNRNAKGKRTYKYFYLSMHPDSLQSRVVETAFKGLTTGSKIKVETSLILNRVDDNLKLFLNYTDPAINAVDKNIEIPKKNFGTGTDGKPIIKSLINEIFITRYPIGKKTFKEIYLKIDALYYENKVRLTNFDSDSNNPYRTFIFYPKSKLIFHKNLK